MHHTGKKESKKEILKKEKKSKVTKKFPQGDSKPEPQNRLKLKQGSCRSWKAGKSWNLRISFNQAWEVIEFNYRSLKVMEN